MKWGKDECYSVGGKMFAVIGSGGTYGGPADRVVIGFKVDDFRFLELTDREGIIPAPYMAKHKWVLVQDTKKVSDAELKEAHRPLARADPVEAPEETPGEVGRAASAEAARWMTVFEDSPRRRLLRAVHASRASPG